MKPIIKRAIVTDEWLSWNDSSWRARLRYLNTPLRWVMPLVPGKTYEFTSYILGYRFEATEREAQIIRSHNLFGEPAFAPPGGEPPLSFADLLGPELIPAVNPSQISLLRMEGQVRKTAACWTHFFETIRDVE